jgi:hypothetical protein
MRTTVNIPDEAFELCKKKARETGTSIGEVLAEAIFFTYRERPKQARARRFELPVSGRGGLCPGVDLDRTAELEDLMEGRA